MRYNALGREGAVLKALKQPAPANLNGMYETLLDECQRRMSSDHQMIASSLLHWVSFAARSLTLAEVESLVKLLAKDDKFGLEEIPEVFSRFLQIGDATYDLEIRQKAKLSRMTEITSLPQPGNEDEEDMYDDSALPVAFQERSMRHFFTSNKETTSSFRWSESESHRRILLFCFEIARPERTDVDTSLQKYCSINFLRHWGRLEPSEHSAAELIEISEVMAKGMTNKTNLAEMQTRANVFYAKSEIGRANV